MSTGSSRRELWLWVASLSINAIGVAVLIAVLLLTPPRPHTVDRRIDSSAALAALVLPFSAAGLAWFYLLMNEDDW